MGASLGPEADDYSFGVTTGSGCPWTASDNRSWIDDVTSGGNGSGTVNYSVEANCTGAERTGRITVQGLPFDITQSAVGEPTVTITAPSVDQTVPNETTTFNFSGSASAPGSAVNEVEWRLNNGGWSEASGATFWSFTATNLVEGPNLVEVRSRNTQNCTSNFESRTITRDSPHGGCVNPSPPQCTPNPVQGCQGTGDHVDQRLHLRLPWMTGTYRLSGAYCDGVHSGYQVDFAMPVGSEVVAIAPGRVIQVMQEGQCTNCGSCILDGGTFVKIQHEVPGSSPPIYYNSAYLHLSQTSVSCGAVVVQGQPIGCSGDTGLSGGPHLHLHVRVSDYIECPASTLCPNPQEHEGVRPIPMAGHVGLTPATIINIFQRDQCYTPFAGGGVPCPGDFNRMNGRDIADIFDFIRAWFLLDQSTDFDLDGVVNVPDIFAFLSAWFAGC